MQPSSRWSRPPWWTSTTTGAVVGGGAGLVVLAPWVTRTGSLLVRDLVAVAMTPGLDIQVLRGGMRLARDVPGEVIAAGVGQVIGGAWVVRLALVLAMMGLGAGVGRVLEGRSTVGVLVAATMAVVNPWMWAHLRQGQWLVVMACAVVPWVALGVAGDDALVTLRAVVLGAVSGVVAVVVVWPTLVVAAVLWRQWRMFMIGSATAALAALPWLVLPGPRGVDTEGFAAFAANADTPLGVAMSLLSGGGYFNTLVASPWRAMLPIAVLATVIAVAALVRVVAFSWPGAASSTTQRAAAAMVVTGLIGWFVATVGATSWGIEVVVELSLRVPALAILRDTHRLLAPLMVATALGGGLLVDDLVVWLAARTAGSRTGLAAVAIGVVVVMLPDPVVGPRLPETSTLPTGWVQAAELINQAADHGAVLVVPYDQVQQYPFTTGPVAVPWRRMVDRPVLVGSSLTVDDVRVDDRVEDDLWAGLAGQPASTWDPSAMAAAGVGWIVVTDPAASEPIPSHGFEVVVSDHTLTVLRVDADVVTPRGPQSPVGPWILWLDALLLATAAFVFLPWRRWQRNGGK